MSLSMWNRHAPTKEKERAREIYSRAVKSGRLDRPSACSECGDSGKIHGHHEDYSKPLEVRWLCSSCHGLAHRCANHPEMESRIGRLRAALLGHYKYEVAAFLGISVSLIRMWMTRRLLVPESTLERIEGMPKDTKVSP